MAHHTTPSGSNLEKFDKQKKAMEQHFNTFLRLTSEMIQEEHETLQHESKSKASLAEVVAEQRQQLDYYKKRLADTEAELERKKRECERLEALLQEQEQVLFGDVEANLEPPAKRPHSQDEPDKSDTLAEESAAAPKEDSTAAN